jgi:hypothetical protein
LHAHKFWIIFSFPVHARKKLDDMSRIEYKFLYNVALIFTPCSIIDKKIILVQLRTSVEIRDNFMADVKIWHLQHK